MNDKELADKVVALGVGRTFPTDPNIWYMPDYTATGATRFVRDWRVAGALMEKSILLNEIG